MPTERPDPKELERALLWARTAIALYPNHLSSKHLKALVDEIDYWNEREDEDAAD